MKCYIGGNIMGKKLSCCQCGIRFNPGVPWALFVFDENGKYHDICESCADDHMVEAMYLLNREMN